MSSSTASETTALLPKDNSTPGISVDYKFQQRSKPESILETSALDGRAGSPDVDNLTRPENADDALRAFSSGEEVIEVDGATNKRLLRTIDKHLLPVFSLS